MQILTMLCKAMLILGLMGTMTACDSKADDKEHGHSHE